MARDGVIQKEYLVVGLTAQRKQQPTPAVEEEAEVDEETKSSICHCTTR